jgi:hypothetical protein
MTEPKRSSEVERKGNPGSILMHVIIPSLVSVIVALLTVEGSLILHRVQEGARREVTSAEFVCQKYVRFFLPMASNLIVTRSLFQRLGALSPSDPEWVAIEHLMSKHNAEIRRLLLAESSYLDPDAPEAVFSELLEHLVQWQIVYQLKYEYKAWNGPVFAGIKKFGWKGFPRTVEKFGSVDDFYLTRTRELRREVHEHLAPAGTLAQCG